MKNFSIESSYAIQKLMLEFLMKETKPIITAKKFEILEDSKLKAFFWKFQIFKFLTHGLKRFFH